MSSLHYRAPSGSAVIAFRRSATVPAVIPTGTTKRPLNWEVRSGSGSRVFVWRRYSTVSGGTSTYTITPSGSVIFSGAVDIQRTTIIAPSGGITFSGAPAITRGYVLEPAGQITFSGTVPVIRTTILTPSGQVFFSGTGSIIFLPDGALDSTGPNRISVGLSRASRLS